MAFCKNCGAQIPEGGAFCPSCGAPVGAPQPPQQQPPQPQGVPYPGGYPPVQQVPQRKKDFTADFDAQDISENKVVAMAAYILGVLGVIVALLGARDSKYAAFHARQALKLEILSSLLVVVGLFLVWTIAVPAVAAICEVILFVVRVICFVQVCMGKAKEAPLVGELPFLR